MISITEFFLYHNCDLFDLYITGSLDRCMCSRPFSRSRIGSRVLASRTLVGRARIFFFFFFMGRGPPKNWRGLNRPERQRTIALLYLDDCSTIRARLKQLVKLQMSVGKQACAMEWGVKQWETDEEDRKA